MRQIISAGLVAVAGFLASCTANLDVTNGTKDSISVTVNGGTAKSIAAGAKATFADVPAGLFDANPTVNATGRLLEGTATASPLVTTSGNNAVTISNNAVVFALKNDTATSYVITNVNFGSGNPPSSYGSNLLASGETIAVNETKYFKAGATAGTYTIRVMANDGYTYTQAYALVKGEQTAKWNTLGFYVRGLSPTLEK